jgi:hypothetical protein
VKILECDDCGYTRSTEQDGREFTRHCVMCGQPDDACECEIVDMTLVCSDCTEARTHG